MTICAACLLVMITAETSLSAKPFTVLAAFAHADDEVLVMPLLAKYAAEGHAVHIAIFPQTLPNPADSAAVKRMGDAANPAHPAELRCAAGKLGIRPPIIDFLGQTPSLQAEATLSEHLRALIDRTKPDVVITFGPDGVTGHARHIAVGNVVTRVFQQQTLLEHKPKKLYYVALPESRFPSSRSPFGVVASGLTSTDMQAAAFSTVSDEFVSTRIDGRAHLSTVREALACHTVPKAERNFEWQAEWYERLAKTLDGNVFLRLVFPQGRGQEADIFAGL